MAPTALPPNTNVTRTQLAYNQHNQVLAEQPKVQHQEEPANSHHVNAKESQEPVKKENIPITEGMKYNSNDKIMF